MNMITQLFEAIGTSVTAMFGVISNGLTSVVGLFYDATTGFTTVGLLLLIGFGVGLVWALISFVMKLVKVSTR